MRKVYLPVLAAALCSPTVAPAEEPQRVLIEVPYGDLDITDPDDVSVLKSRMATLIVAACAMEGGISSNRPATDWACVATAKRDGLAKLEARKAAKMALAAR